MTENNNCLKEAAAGLSSLCIFRGLLKDPVIEALHRFACEPCPEKCAEFVSVLYQYGTDLGEYVLNAVLEDENAYMLRKAEDRPCDLFMEECVAHELEIFERLCALTPEMAAEAMEYTGWLPHWHAGSKNIAAVYSDRLTRIHEHGYGIFAKYHTFIISDGTLVPVKHPDAISVDELGGYQVERQAVIDNTLALVEGRPAANALLYGDAGTGKSSTVKAVANQFRDRGLRLIELKKNQLHEIPHLVDQLSKNPLKFILFIDDLSFTKNDDDFAALKAILEGSVSARANNLAVYATSNRRHLIKESFSDRDGDEVHVNDTLEELISLSDRFGLTITFQKPQKKVYLEIVHDLALRYGVMMPQDQLDVKAEAFAINRGGRSARAAKQFIESLKAKEL